MGWFDAYVPRPSLKCPACGAELTRWQGNDGPCLLLVWEQGRREPHPTSAEVCVDGIGPLPSEFLICSRDCACFPHGVEAVGRTSEGVWQSTEFLTADLVDRFHYSRPKAERSARAE